MNLPASTRGLVLLNVVENGPADRAGLRDRGRTFQVEGEEFPLGGDVVLAINGALLRDMDDLVAYLVEETRPGDEVSLDVIRTDGQTESVTVTLGIRPQPDAIN
jgi:S1-C subfamily serine protease